MVKASGVAIVPDGIEFSEETNEFDDLYLKSIQRNENIFVDRTNTSKKGRNKLLNRSSKIKKDYIKEAWVYCVPRDEIYHRNYLRKEKQIDLNVIEMFRKSLNIPDLEQFDVVKFLWR